MSKRRKMPMKASKKVFTKTAMRVHPKNALPGASAVMRGGIRF
jgi:hypothetical protein